MLSQGSPHRPALTDLALELAQTASGFRHSLPDGVVTALAELVRAMNCYYSNLIEGHDTHPVDIERALREDYSTAAKKRDLQLEARAHIAVQKWIDEGGLDGRTTSVDGIIETHRRFCELRPKDLLWVEHPQSKEKLTVVPGGLREHDVEVGNHVAPSPGAIPHFLERFENIYSGLGVSETILATAAAHHRLLWIHPFLGGNGRVARLMSYATLLQTLDTGGIWSIARGLARSEQAYKQHLTACDATRRNDLDGRGHLSEEALAILYRGELPRGDVPNLLDTSDRTARRVVSALVERGVITARTTKSPLRITFPAKLASRWMPGLFPEQIDKESTT